MAIEIKMPQLSDTMHEGTILTWLKNEGDEIERGDALAEVATDKADLEIESFNEGVLLKIIANVGTTVATGEIIAYLGEAGETVNHVASESTDSTSEEATKESAPETKQVEQVSAPVSIPPQVTSSAPTQSSSNNGRIKACLLYTSDAADE